MNESQASEVEKVLLHISDARDRARRAAAQVSRDGAEGYVVEALRQAEDDLTRLHRRLSQGTYYAVPDPALKLSV